MLVDAGLIGDDQLRQALAEQKGTSLKLGQFLVRQGIVREEQIVHLLSQQLGIERYVPDKYPIDVNLASVIPAATARKYQLVPLSRQPNLFVIAMVDPTDINSLDAVEEVTNQEVEPVICTEGELNQLMSSIYGVSPGGGGIWKKMEFGTEPEEDAPKQDVQISSLVDMAEGVPVVRMVNWVIAQAVREGASDIHISPERDYIQLRFRIDGKLKEVPPPPKTMLLPIISRIKILANMDISLSMVPQDGRFTAKIDDREIHVRASSLPTVNGENIVLRLLDVNSVSYTLDSLGMSVEDREKLEAQIDRPHGMILSTGPTGSGKTTSLYSILRKLNRPDINIITIEDPVEYRIEKIRQIQLNTKAGMTFASGLRSILRQDPDVIMVGEIRDSDTAAIAVRSALTGHRLLSTVHTNSAAGAVTRLIDMGVAPVLLASVLLVSFAQRLVRRACPHCSQVYRPSPETLEFWGVNDADLGNASFVQTMGCHLCLHTGFRGRTGIYEVLVVDSMIQDLIIGRKSTQEITRSAHDAGVLVTLKDDAFRKACQGITTLEEASSAVMA